MAAPVLIAAFLTLLIVSSAEISSSGSRVAVLDVISVLNSLRSTDDHPAAATAALEDEQQQQQQFMSIVHRSKLQQGRNATQSDLMQERLRRDNARIESIKQRLEMATHKISPADANLPMANGDLKAKNRSNKAGSRKRGRASAAGGGAGGGNPVTSGLVYGSGEYFVRMGVGTPAKSMYLVMDTGSDVPWIQCSPCRSCYRQADAIFDPSKSSSYSRIPCSSPQCKQLDVKACSTSDNRCLYQVSYGDGSFTVGDLATDNLGGAPAIFGCGHDNEGLFVGAAGLLGLGAGKLSFPSQRSSTGGSKKFSYCLVSRDNANRASSSLLFGDGAIDRSSSSSMIFTPLLKNPRLDTFYYTGLVAMSVGGSRLRIPASVFKLVASSGRGGVILDSGTSVTRLPSAAYAVLRDAFREGTKSLPSAAAFSLFDTCYDFSQLSSVAIPTVVLHFDGGAAVQLPAGNYMVPVDSSGTFCFAFAKTSLDLSIIGNIQQQTMRIAIDLDNSRIGIAPKQCS